MRLINRKVLRSSLYYQLGESFPGKELHAQRIFQALILIADDQGRGRWIPEDIRMEAFASARTAFAEVAIEEIENWMEVIEKNGSAFRYEIGNERYFFLPKWYEYQHLRYHKVSHIPPPTKDFLAKLGLKLSDFPESWQTIFQKDGITAKKTNGLEKSDIRKEVKRKEKKRNNTMSPKNGDAVSDKNKNKRRIISDAYQNCYIERFDKKPTWGDIEGKRISELLKRFNDDAERIALAIQKAFKSEDTYMQGIVGSFMTLTATANITKADTLGVTNTSMTPEQHKKYMKDKHGVG